MADRDNTVRVFTLDPPPKEMDPVTAEWLVRQFERINNATYVTSTVDDSQDQTSDGIRTDLDSHIQNVSNPHTTRHEQLSDVAFPTILDNPHGMMRWRGVWAAGDYLKHDVVTDGQWTMVANKDTSEYPFPQAVAAVAWAVFGDTVPAWVAQSTSTTRLLTGVRITPDAVASVQGLRGWIPIIDPDVAYFLVSIVDGQVPQYEELFPTTTGWRPITFPANLLGVGAPVEIYLVTQGQGTTATTFTYNWNRRSPSATPNPSNPPLPGQFVHYVIAAPDIAYINKTDNDGVARKGDLDTLQAGDTVAWTDSGGVDVFYTLTADPIYHNSAVGDEDFYELNLSPAEGQGSNGVVAMTFTHFLDRPTSYVQITNQFAGVAGVTGLLSTTGNVADAVETDDAYGIDVLYQEIAFPLDWDVVAYSA